MKCVMKCLKVVSDKTVAILVRFAERYSKLSFTQSA